MKYGRCHQEPERRWARPCTMERQCEPRPQTQIDGVTLIFFNAWLFSSMNFTDTLALIVLLISIQLHSLTLISIKYRQ